MVLGSNIRNSFSTQKAISADAHGCKLEAYRPACVPKRIRNDYRFASTSACRHDGRLGRHDGVGAARQSEGPLDFCIGRAYIIFGMRRGYVYILTNFARTCFYIGVTSNLGERIRQHVNGEGSVFTRKYNLTDLVYVEAFDRISDAIAREKQLKNWHRDWKIRLIKSVNPEMKDLTDQLPWMD